jgi:hypothetical protein
MERSAKARQGVRFDAFEVDLEERELRRSGLKVKIQEQPCGELPITETVWRAVPLIPSLFSSGNL